MKQNIILKSLVRKPIIAILLTLLIGLVSYGFAGKAVETIIVWRETNRLEGYYRSIGYISKDFEGEEHYYAEGAALIEQSPTFSFGDQRRQAAGFMQDYNNTDFDYGTMDVPETLYEDASLWYGEGSTTLIIGFMAHWFIMKKSIRKRNRSFFLGIYWFLRLTRSWQDIRTGFKLERNMLSGYPNAIQQK